MPQDFVLAYKWSILLLHVLGSPSATIFYGFATPSHRKCLQLKLQRDSDSPWHGDWLP